MAMHFYRNDQQLTAAVVGALAAAWALGVPTLTVRPSSTWPARSWGLVWAPVGAYLIGVMVGDAYAR